VLFYAPFDEVFDALFDAPLDALFDSTASYALRTVGHDSNTRSATPNWSGRRASRRRVSNTVS